MIAMGIRERRRPARAGSWTHATARFCVGMSATRRRCSILRSRAPSIGLVVFLASLACGHSALGADLTVFTSPDAPVPGGSLRVMAVSGSPVDATVAVVGPAGDTLARTTERHGGPPYWWYVDAPTSAAGTYRVCLGENTPCTEVPVGDRVRRRQPVEAAWRATREWNRATEELYAAWIERLFDDPLQAQPSWRALHEVTRQRERNFLYDHLGLGEDGEHGLRLEPDCADLPYFLRAYFAWKLALPFGYSECSRGSGARPPVCSAWHSSADALPPGADELAAMQRVFRRIADVVQSGNGRTPGKSERTDFYPVRLTIDALTPGTVYADPYGHTLLLVHRIPQTRSAAGGLLAVDAQPDGTVARKRYWRGNFLFAVDPALGSPGFKHFRPVALADGRPRPLTNQEIALSPDYGDYGLDQYDAGVEGFYDRVDAVLSPQPLAPERALREGIDALDEQVRTRVRSVANGQDYVAAHRGVIPMPEGAAIFETTGTWEDYATPSRDLRLLIALDALEALPGKIATHPERFEKPVGRTDADLPTELAAMLRAELAARVVVYTRSDGSQWTLTLADVLARARALEVAYNPNDCVEVRWGAPPIGPEASTCRRRAPAEQIARMARNRTWFHERRRPPR